MSVEKATFSNKFLACNYDIGYCKNHMHLRTPSSIEGIPDLTINIPYPVCSTVNPEGKYSLFFRLDRLLTHNKNKPHSGDIVFQLATMAQMLCRFCPFKENNACTGINIQTQTATFFKNRKSIFDKDRDMPNIPCRPSLKR